MNAYLVCIAAGVSFLLSFLLLFHPLQQNLKANRWLSFFVFLMALAFSSIYWLNFEEGALVNPVYKVITAMQFLLGPSFLLSVFFFVQPARVFRKTDYIHFIPSFVYLILDLGFNSGKDTVSVRHIFEISKDVSFLVRDLLPFITLAYLGFGFFILERHKKNIRRISSSLQDVDLNWLTRFLFILLFILFVWMNDALFELPGVTTATPFLYIGALFFLAYFSMRQKAVFDYEQKLLPDIAVVLREKNIVTGSISDNSKTNIEDAREISVPVAEDIVSGKESHKTRRLKPEQVVHYSALLTQLMERDKMYLDNELSLPVVAKKLGLSIPETSFLINESSQSNFFTFINRFRVEEAKRLLASSKMEELNILGIAFAAGFNSKTTFNTTFKKFTGISPSAYSQQHKNPR